MKTIQQKQLNFQNFYASRFMTAILFVAAFEIYILVMLFGGAR